MIGYSKNHLPAQMLGKTSGARAAYGQGSPPRAESNNPPKNAWEWWKSANQVFLDSLEQPVEQLRFSNNLPAADLVARARHELGSRYGLGRPLYKAELARLIGLADGPGNVIDKLEHGRAKLSGPVAVVIRMLLDGYRSPRHDQALKPEVRGARGRRSDLAKA